MIKKLKQELNSETVKIIFKDKYKKKKKRERKKEKSANRTLLRI